MKKEVIVCDQCKKETYDFYESQGWIRIESAASSSITILIAMGRRQAGDAKHSGYVNVKELHFCCIDCLSEYLKNLIIDAYEKEAKLFR